MARRVSPRAAQERERGRVHRHGAATHRAPGAPRTAAGGARGRGAGDALWRHAHRLGDLFERERRAQGGIARRMDRHRRRAQAASAAPAGSRARAGAARDGDGARRVQPLRLAGYLPLPPVPARIKLYADRAARSSEVKPDGVITIVVYSLSALPEEQGRYTLPAVRVPYFDTSRGELAVAELAGPVLEVNGAPISAATATGQIAQTSTNKSTATPALASSGDGNAHLWQWGSFIFAVLWLATLALWWRSARPRVVEINASAQKKVAPPQAQHPLQAQLLAALGGRSLDLGLREWEATHGIDLEVHAAVRAVQSLLYGPRKGVEEDAIAAQVKAAVATIRGAKPPCELSSKLDPWRPESFCREVPPA